MPDLVLGPLLRYVDDSTATVWVETDGPCDVNVLGRTSPTFTVHGHHYAFVDVENLEPGTSVTYEVAIDGRRVWPPTSWTFPSSRIRPLKPSEPLRLVTGSCRRDGPHDEGEIASLGIDALRSYGLRLAAAEESSWPTALMLIGDQVYADATPAALRDIIASRRDPRHAPGWEVANFEEYTHLYRLSWGDPVVRWLLSTIPSMMIFDDHDIRDDWNISREWLARMEATSWWPKRIVGGLGAYWIYQHLGNLSPIERRADPLYAALHDSDARGSSPTMTAIVGSDGADPESIFDDDPSDEGGRILDELVRRADQQRDGRWAYVRDIGRTRLLVLDSRGGRVLEPRNRRMLGPRQLEWFDAHARGDLDHLVVATSIPYLLTAGIHHLEAWNEAVCGGAWGARLVPWGERLRQGYDLEHWASFQKSFAAVASAVTEVATGQRGEPPASITFLSGDVHYSYLARAHVGAPGTGGRLGRRAAASIHQVVSSPMRNTLPTKLRLAVAVASLGLVGVVCGLLARTAGVRPTPLSWRLARGNWYDNTVATLELNGRRASVRWEAPRDTGLLRGSPPLRGPTRTEEVRLHTLAAVDLTDHE